MALIFAIFFVSSLVLAASGQPVKSNSSAAEEFNQLFLVGGHKAEKKVEIINLAGVQKCGKTPPDFPVVDQGAMGVFIDNSAMVCGGEYDGSIISRNCSILDAAKDKWTQVDPMTTARAAAATILLSPTKWWVTGGFDTNRETLITTEVFNAGEGFEVFADLPEATARHALVKVNTTHVMLIGGLMSTNTKVWLFDIANENWTLTNETLSVFTSSPQAAFVMKEGGGSKGEVVVSAGVRANSTRIYNVEKGEWRAGPDMPAGVGYGRWLQRGDSFIVVGGYTEKHVQDFIYSFDAEKMEFIELPQKLSIPKSEFAAFFAPEDFYKC